MALTVSNASEPMVRLQTVLDRLKAASVRVMASRREHAPEYNPFRLLGLARAEVGLHSPFLADLLDPHGTHGQGGVFLREFFRCIARQEANLNALPGMVSDFPFAGEWLVEREKQHIDIVVRSRRHGVLIFIENKIDAVEQDRQLERYQALLKATGRIYGVSRLLLVAPRGYQTYSGSPHIVMSYEDDIADWVVQSLAQVRAPGLRAALKQYLSIIRNLTEEHRMPYTAEVLDLLTSPDNIAATLEIADAMPDLKDRLRARFWDAVAGRLREEIENLGLEHSWSVDRRSAESPSSEWYGVQASLRPPSDAPRLLLGVWQEKGRLYTGVAFDKEQANPVHPSPEVEELRADLKRKRLGTSDKWHVAWRWTDIYLLSNDELTTIANDSRMAADHALTDVLDILRENPAALARADAALSEF